MNIWRARHLWLWLRGLGSWLIRRWKLFFFFFLKEKKRITKRTPSLPESPVFVVIWRKGRKTQRLEQLPLKTHSVNTELFRLGLEFINVSRIGRWRGRRLNTGWKRLRNLLVPPMGGFAVLYFFTFISLRLNVTMCRYIQEVFAGNFLLLMDQIIKNLTAGGLLQKSPQQNCPKHPVESSSRHPDWRV